MHALAQEQDALMNIPAFPAVQVVWMQTEMVNAMYATPTNLMAVSAKEIVHAVLR
jgi:hypothetical protein